MLLHPLNRSLDMVFFSLRNLARRLAGPSRRRRPAQARAFRPELLRLEDRLVPSTVVWDGGPQGTGTLWSDPTNWVGGHVPGGGDDAVIDASFAGSTILADQDVTIHSVTSEAALQITGGRFFITSDSLIDNDVLVSQGPHALPANLFFVGTLTVRGAFTQTGGTTVLLTTTAHNATTLDTAFVDIRGGRLTGEGTITGDVQNAGTIELGVPDPTRFPVGTLNVGGNYTQTASGVLVVKVGQQGPDLRSDFLNVAGTATLDGTLNISLIYNYRPQAGDAFVPLSFGDRSGNFATVNGQRINDHLAFGLAFDDHNLFLQANEVSEV
jgi:hypothetical protein